MEREAAEQRIPWLEDLDSTLNSAEGTKALESYLIRRNSLSLLEFIWACDGLKNLAEESPNKADDLVTCIYKNYIINGSLPTLSDQVVMSIAKQLEAHFERPEPSDFSRRSTKIVQPIPLELTLFDDARSEVDSHLRTQVFPQFQKAVEDGEVYISFNSMTGCNDEKNNDQLEHVNKPIPSRLAGQPEVFARALCEKLEGLMQNRGDNP